MDLKDTKTFSSLPLPGFNFGVSCRAPSPTETDDVPIMDPTGGSLAHRTQSGILPGNKPTNMNLLRPIAREISSTKPLPVKLCPGPKMWYIDTVTLKPCFPKNGRRDNLGSRLKILSLKSCFKFTQCTSTYLSGVPLFCPSQDESFKGAPFSS